MTYTIHTTSGGICHQSTAATTLRDAVIEAVRSGASLAGASLSHADLRDADLRHAGLSYASLRGVDFAGARLAGAGLAGADLTGANLRGANLIDVSLSGAALRDARIDGVPIIPHIHQAVRDAIFAPGCSLDMTHWHTCDTTHCRAGWVVHLADAAGADLESRIGTGAAAAAIYFASDSHMEEVPDFYAGDEDAVADIIACAEAEAKREREAAP